MLYEAEIIFYDKAMKLNVSFFLIYLEDIIPSVKVSAIIQKCKKGIVVRIMNDDGSRFPVMAERTDKLVTHHKYVNDLICKINKHYDDEHNKALSEMYDIVSRIRKI